MDDLVPKGAIAGTRTEGNLRAAFAREAQIDQLYRYFAFRAESEGYHEVAGLFRALAEGETGHAMGHLEYLAEVGCPLTGAHLGKTPDNLRSALVLEREDAETGYAAMATVAREEGLEDAAAWFESLARAEKAHLEKLTRALAALG